MISMSIKNLSVTTVTNLDSKSRPPSCRRLHKKDCIEILVDLDFYRKLVFWWNLKMMKQHIRHIHIRHMYVSHIRILLALTKSACAPFVKVMRRGLGRARAASSDIAWNTCRKFQQQTISDCVLQYFFILQITKIRYCLNIFLLILKNPKILKYSYYLQDGTSRREYSKPELILTFILKVRMLRFGLRTEE